MTSGRPSPEKPNILFIFTDQQHAGMLGCAGNAHVRTPNLDRLASRGTRFERAYSVNPVCIPARFSLMTGRPPSVIGMEANEDHDNPVPEAVLRTSLGTWFRDAGYRTVYGGKIHLPGPGEIKEQVEPYGFEDLGRDSRGGLAKRCAEFLGEPHDEPFLLVASFINPHDICYLALNEHRRRHGQPEAGGPAAEALDQALQAHSDAGRNSLPALEECPLLPENFEVPERELSVTMADKPAFMRSARQEWGEREWRLHRWAYARLTEQVDREIGVVLQALETSPYADNTIVVFTSDHGDQDGAHRCEHKGFLYEESVRVPLILNAPRQVPTGTVDRDHLVSVGLDLLPTLCDLAGIPMPEDLPGQSLRPLLRDDPPAAWRDHVVVENHLGRLVHTGRWKYMAGRPPPHDPEKCPHCRDYTTPYRPEVPEALFDLEHDPGEMANRADDPACAAQVRAGRESLRKWYEDRGLALDPDYLLI